MRNLIVFICLFSLIVIRCTNITKPSNPPERNKIVINVSPNQLEDSLKVFEPLMNKLPLSEFGDIRYKLRDSNLLIINNTAIDIKKTLNDTINNIEVLKDFSKQELNRILKLIVFFNTNYLSYGIYYRESNSFLFYYRKIKINNSDWEYDLHRFIYYSPKYIIFDRRAFKEMDKKGNLYLLAHSDAHIW